MAKTKVKAKSSKKCSGCGLDCTVLRAIALAAVPDSMKKEKAIVMFGSAKPKYEPATCPKRG